MSKEIKALVGAFVKLIVLSMIPAFVWFAIDDTFAKLINVPQLGQLPFFFVWPLCFLINCLFKSTCINH